MEKLCSVIIPAYNAERYIRDTLNSVLNQTYKTLEIIIINDCSKDNTIAMLREYEKIDDRIKIYENEKNSGVSATRNFGINISEGEFIAFLDSDDIWEYNKLEKQIEILNKTGSKLCCTGCSFINSEGKSLSKIFQIPKVITYNKLLYQNKILCSSVVIKREVLEKYNFYGDYMHEDFVLWLKILKDYGHAIAINEPLLIYRIASNSKSGNKIKSIKMTYEVYKYMKIPFIKRFYYLFFYIINGIKKYGKTIL